mmetsp:Transcript_59195/g.135791  ORF Transcript_59195/g.135791 Transcript_59195/m.135791 type:complete len:353 (+) Transcript_59195:503-1561(+)
MRARTLPSNGRSIPAPHHRWQQAPCAHHRCAEVQHNAPAHRCARRPLPLRLHDCALAARRLRRRRYIFRAHRHCRRHGAGPRHLSPRRGSACGRTDQLRAAVRHRRLHCARRPDRARAPAQRARQQDGGPQWAGDHGGHARARDGAFSVGARPERSMPHLPRELGGRVLATRSESRGGGRSPPPPGASAEGFRRPLLARAGTALAGARGGGGAGLSHRTRTRTQRLRVHAELGWRARRSGRVRGGAAALLACSGTQARLCEGAAQSRHLALVFWRERERGGRLQKRDGRRPERCAAAAQPGALLGEAGAPCRGHHQLLRGGRRQCRVLWRGEAGRGHRTGAAGAACRGGAEL